MSDDSPHAVALPSRRSPEPVRTAIREALGAYAAPEIAEGILERALLLGADRALPHGGAPLIEFLNGPLEAAVTEVLGSDAATHVLEELGPILAMAGQPAESGVRERAGGADAWARPNVLVVSADAELARDLDDQLGGRGRVKALDDGDALLAAIAGHGDSLVVVVDGRVPVVPATKIAELAAAMPDRARAVLWGIDIVLHGVAEGNAGVTWIPLSAEGTVEELGWICQAPPTHAGRDPADDDWDEATPVCRPVGKAG